jgi:acyl transferase domain-containing protein
VLLRDEPAANLKVISCLSHANDPASEIKHLLDAIGKAWLAGVEIDWDGFYTHERRQRVCLPSYPFERQRYWLESSRTAKPSGEIVNRENAGQELLSITANGLQPAPTEPPEPQAAALKNSPAEHPASPPNAFGDETVGDEDVSLALERVMGQQLHVMAKQLELLRNSDINLDAADETGL